ncbi:Histone H [Heracleum sosnowskyi]|uniref:Histone H n=1 Tax=Heracleum sosnowskyi TaxID=360622 RepID=A0AAD8GZH6_9APIA|nr:Histone H [Heracleum sosnowskyi]
MSTTEAVTKIAAVKPSKTAAKEKKAPVSNPKSVKNASHPPYFEMIKDALLALKEKGGSSPYAIGKYIEEKRKATLPGNFRKILGQQLKNSATKGNLIKVKASYKLSDPVKKAAQKSVSAEKKSKKAKLIVEGAAKPVKKAVKKAKTKKAATPVKKAAKAKAKQPKSIKSPVKKAKKAGAGA